MLCIGCMRPLEGSDRNAALHKHALGPGNGQDLAKKKIGGGTYGIRSSKSGYDSLAVSAAFWALVFLVGGLKQSVGWGVMPSQNRFLLN